MKALQLATLALGAGSMALKAAPRLFVSTPTLTPESGIELILDQAAVSNDTLGKTVSNDWLTIEPALNGKLEWKTPSVARFIPDQAPAIGTTYRFSVKSGHKHLDRTAVPAGLIATVASTPFQPDQLRRFYHPESSSLRNSEWIIRFNDFIDPEAASSQLRFVSGNGLEVKAKVDRVSYETIRQMQFESESWGRRFERARLKPGDPPLPQPENSQPFRLALRVTPETPLPVAENWSLLIPAGLPNQAKTAKTIESVKRSIGTIASFKVHGVEAITNANEPRTLSIRFSSPLNPLTSETTLPPGLSISPTPQNLKLSQEYNTLLIQGDFGQQDSWTVNLGAPLSSHDGLPLDKPYTQTVKFKHLEPSIGLPSEDESQLAAGTRQYRIESVNLREIKLRVKAVKNTELVRTLQGYRHYTGRGPNQEAVRPTSPIPFSLIPGEIVLEKTFSLDSNIDTSKILTLAWDELLPGSPKHQALFVEATGLPIGGSIDPETAQPPNPSAQAFVQLTDLGLAWKLTPQEALIYAFSCVTGEPLKDTNLEIYGEEAKLLNSVRTDANGLAKLPRTEASRHLRVSLGDDQVVQSFDRQVDTVSLWRFPVRYSWDTPAPQSRRVLVFTDRSLYRPGETVRIKGIVRTQNGNTISQADSANPSITIVDPADKILLTRNLTLSPNGTFDLEFPASGTSTGHHTIRIEYPEQIAKAEAIEDDWSAKEQLLSNARFEFGFRIDEFRRNAFEIEQTFATTKPGDATLDANANARYYQGQPVATGKAQWFARLSETNLYPENFRDFLFGDHRQEDWGYWYHYFGYRYGDDAEERNSTTQKGEITLDASGKGSIRLEIPQSDFPTARKVLLNNEITDANHQTLTATSETTLHPASIYLGISRVDRLIRVGDQVPLQLVTIDVDGNPSTSPTQVTATLTREVNEQSRTRNADGADIVRNDAREETVSTTTLDLKGGKDAGTYSLSPSAPGRYTLILRSKDPEGKAFATRTTYYVYGSNEYPWAYEQGMKIKLVAEKKLYQPGETARVLVLSPIEGTALVTIERDQILRTFVAPIKASNPVIEVPLSDLDAPNVFLSVLVIKGSQDSARKFKEPQLRLGYCELTVEERANRLTLESRANNPTDTTSAGTNGVMLASYRPGEEVEWSGTVRRADGSPAAGAEVTLYAEDEGTLAVMGYDNPDPLAFFYDPRLLLVETGTSLDHFLAEDPEEQSFSNKGFFVGGGDDLANALADLLRKNFDPCATWAPRLTTDAQGRFTHRFKVPDTLTRYRVLAVATDGPSRFGSLRADFIVNKPLMLEPKVSRFAHVSDQLQPQVLIQNASSYQGTWKVSLAPDSQSSMAIIQPLGETETTVTLEPGSSKTVSFRIRVDSEGDAALTFKAVPVSLNQQQPDPILARKLSDHVESRFPVHYPMPKLRQSKLIRLQKDGRGDEIEAALDPVLLRGDGTLELEASSSPLLEAAGAVQDLLSYPHGCVEQTTSSLMPWFAVTPLRPYVPSLRQVSEEKVQTAIQKGVDRLLSMQLPSGGFGYWPGATERVSWASAYAGLGLVYAKEAGANVPQESLDHLAQDLITSLHGLASVKSAYDLEIACRGLWVLAKLGKPQSAYHSLLRDRMKDLSPTARAFLAIAMHTAGEPNALAVIESNAAYSEEEFYWMRWNPSDAVELLARSTIAANTPSADAVLDRLIRDRSPYGGWRTTWVNGWSVLAMAQYAKGLPAPSDSTQVTIVSADSTREMKLTPENSAATVSLKTGSSFSVKVKADHSTLIRASLHSRPPIAPQQPVSRNGMQVTRFYERVNPDGTTEPITQPKVGDLIRVTLRIVLPNDQSRYLAIEDPLPSIFETVNSAFASQSAANPSAQINPDWRVTHQELRTDRALFYLDYIPKGGSYTVQYLVRCTLAGDAIAPPAKVEWMYDPENYALSDSRSFQAQ